MYNTKQRKLITDYLSQSHGRVTVNDIESHFSKAGTRIGTSTIYRSLEKLLKDGKIRRFTSEEGSSFQWVHEDCKNHYHFICSKCGELMHVECRALDKACSHITDEHNFRIDMGKTVFCGECEKCALREDV